MTPWKKQLNHLLLSNLFRLQCPQSDTYTRKRAEEAEDDGRLDAGGRVADRGLSGGGPLVGQVAEADEEHEGPEEVEGHVGQHVMLARLHRGHLLEHVLADQEADRGHERNDADCKGKR